MADYYFQLIRFEQLSPTQQTAVTDDNAIALSGGPGTGKSMVSLWRHILNHRKDTPKNSQLLTYTTSLALYLKRCCVAESIKAYLSVDSTTSWLYRAKSREEIIHDEAQDIPVEKNRELTNYSKQISYGADNQQLIAAHARKPDNTYDTNVCSPEDNLRELFSVNSLHTLSVNHRNSKKIMKLAKVIFSNAAIPREIIDSCTTDGQFPRLFIINDINKINSTILDLVRSYRSETTNIGILVPFEKPPYSINKTASAQYHYNLLKTNGFDCSIYTNSMGGCTELKNIHITTFKSAKGMEFDVVILPDFHLYNCQFNVVDWHDYYVGLTRTKSNLFLLCRKDINIPHEGVNKVIDKINI